MFDTVRFADTRNRITLYAFAKSRVRKQDEGGSPTSASRDCMRHGLCLHQERLDQHAPTGEVMDADAPFGPVFLAVQFIHDAGRDLDRPAGETLGTPNVPANCIKDECVAVGGVEAVTGHPKQIPQLQSLRTCEFVLCSLWGYPVEKGRAL